MARYSLRAKIKEMEVGEILKVPTDYEGITIRNYATCTGREMERSYSVRKQTKGYIVIRNA